MRNGKTPTDGNRWSMSTEDIAATPQEEQYRTHRYGRGPHSPRRQFVHEVHQHVQNPVATVLATAPQQAAEYALE